MSSISLEPKLYTPNPNPNGFYYPVADNDPDKPTFILAAYGVVPGASATDLVNIKNNGTTKLLRVKSVLVAGAANTAVNVQLSLIRRSALSTGGASTTPSPGVLDTSDPATQAVCQVWTAAPTPGAALGQPLGQTRLNLAPAAAAGVDRTNSWQKAWQNEKAIIIRPSEVLALNLNGRTYAAGEVLDFEIVWTEELL